MSYNDEISNSQDLIDSRDIVERIKELEQAQEDFKNDKNIEEDYLGFEENDENSPWFEWDQIEEARELYLLQSLAEEASQYSDDWKYGTTLICDSYFVEYCMEMVKDFGDLPQDLPFYIENNIDWDGVAEDLKVDYNSVDFDGVTYWIR